MNFTMCINKTVRDKTNLKNQLNTMESILLLLFCQRKAFVLSSDIQVFYCGMLVKKYNEITCVIIQFVE